MNQLCVPVPSASDTAQILHQVFALCRIPWVYDFLFTVDAAADLSILLAPVQRRHALAARIYISATETSSKYAHSFDFNKELMFYSIPAFSVDAITVGFCIEQSLAHFSSSSPDDVQCIRFVRDDNRGIFLHICQNLGASGITQIDYLSLNCSTTTLRRVRIKLDYYLFNKHKASLLLCSSPTNNNNDNDNDKETESVEKCMMNFLIYLHVSNEKRACTLCNENHSSNCHCTLPLRRPTHALDFAGEFSNMKLYTGFYQGATVVRLCSKGHAVINATLQSGSVIQGEMNKTLISKLHHLALRDCISKVKARNLFTPVMKPVATTSQEDDAELHCSMNKLANDANDVLQRLEKKARSNTNKGNAKQTVHNSNEQQQDNTKETETETERNIMHMQYKATEECESIMREMEKRRRVSKSKSEEGESDSGCLTLIDNDALSLLPSLPSLPSLPLPLPLPLDGELPSSNNSTDGLLMSGIVGYASSKGVGVGVCKSLMEATEVMQSLDEDTASHDLHLSLVMEKEEEGLDHLAARVAPPAGTGTDNKQREEEEEEECKLEIRKKRNREAAARSNLKRKLHNERVRRDLATLTQKAVQLRVREMMLRDENTRLRNAVKSAQVAR